MILTLIHLHLFLPVCVSIYELITGLPESEMPYYWYTDQRFALFLLSLFFIFPLSVPKEISIQKYTRWGSVFGQLFAYFLDYLLFRSIIIVNLD